MEVLLTPQIEAIIKMALEEDIGAGDLTTLNTIPPEQRAKGLFRAKRDCTVAGLFLLERLFSFLDSDVQIRCLCRDGDQVSRGTVIAEAEGVVRALLMGERTALNFLQRLSGTATLTRRYVDTIKDLPSKIIDTRKTTPGLRTLEKYAVRMGGGTNHRLGLYDAAIIKDNHIAASGSIAQAVENVRSNSPFMSRVEVECEDLKQVQKALDVKADVIMLDNMDTATMKEAVKLIKKRVWVEASGGITMERVREVAEAGVDFISVGALTHSAPAVDFNMKIVPVGGPRA
ncbi:MAG: carboxylating nicotinate-nucleotide diphosphorylase [Candidatus Binatia bacterium]